MSRFLRRELLRFLSSYDGLLDITHGCTGITVTNSYVRRPSSFHLPTLNRPNLTEQQLYFRRRRPCQRLRHRQLGAGPGRVSLVSQRTMIGVDIVIRVSSRCIMYSTTLLRLDMYRKCNLHIQWHQW